MPCKPLGSPVTLSEVHRRLTRLAVDLGQHILDGVPVTPQTLGVRGRVAVAATPVSNVLGFKWGQVVKS